MLTKKKKKTVFRGIWLSSCLDHFDLKNKNKLHATFFSENKFAQNTLIMQSTLIECGRAFNQLYDYGGDV